MNFPWRFRAALLQLLFFISVSAHARPYAGVSGLAASADSATTAGTNPAGMVRFDAPAARGELVLVYSESTWEGRLGDSGREVTSEDDTTILVPSGYMVRPINENWSFGFTILGFGYSDDFGDWPGRYFIESYDSISVSAFPSLAWRINDRWSVAASLALNYARFEQTRSVANLFDPGVADGSVELETDGLDLGFGLSALYQLSEQTRVGLAYTSELNPTQEGKAKFRDLGPNTEQVLERAGFLGADVEVMSTTPQSLLTGLYHEFDNDHSLVVDLAWSDFSSFELSEYYFDGEALSTNTATWQDIWALSTAYTWPVGDRWMLSAGGLYVSDGVEDDDRIFLLRLDDMWGVAFAAEWQWKPDRRVEMNLSYLSIGDAPIASPAIPVVGPATGKYTERDILIFRLALNFGPL
jgi:long-chain fatty acid transport protein